MELDQVVSEYGRLQLNFVACQRQNTLLSTQLAQMNKANAAVTKDAGKALARVAQLEAEMSQHGLSLPEVPADPEPAKDTGAGEQAPQPQAQPAQAKPRPIVVPDKPQPEN